MQCPYCEKEMKAGTLNWHSGSMTWLPLGERPALREGEYQAGAVLLDIAYNGLRPNVEADYCPACRKIVVSL